MNDPRQTVLDLYENYNQEGHLSESAEDAVQDFTYKLLAKFCETLGHESIADQCGRPEHDYCKLCNDTTPGQAKRPTATA